jgi:hypothetical protein
MPFEKRFLKKWFSPQISSKPSSPQETEHRKKKKRRKRKKKRKKLQESPQIKGEVNILRGEKYFNFKDHFCLLEYLGWGRSHVLSGSLCFHDSDLGNLSNNFSYVICAFTYHMVESDIVLLYIRSRVSGIIYAVGPGVATVQTPQMPFPYDIWQQRVLDIAIDEVLGALSMHVAPPAIRIVCGTRRSDNSVRAS